MAERTFSHREEFHKQKRRTQVVRAWCAFFLIVVCVGGLAYVAHRPSLRISQVDLTGGVLVAKGDVQEETLRFLSGSYLFLFPKDNIFLYPRGALTNDLKNHFQRIDTISVGQENLHTLSVTITERKPSALWCGASPSAVVTTSQAGQSSQCYFMDDESTIFAVAPDFSGDAYFKYYGDVSTTSPISPAPIGAQYISSSTLFSDISNFVDFTRTLGLHPQYLVQNDADDFSLVIGGGGQIYFDTDEPLSQVSQNLQALLTRIPVLTPNPAHDLPVDYIDMRYGNKLFYKLSGTAVATTSAN
jgi:hypothetical protein